MFADTRLRLCHTFPVVEPMNPGPGLLFPVVVLMNPGPGFSCCACCFFLPGGPVRARVHVVVPAALLRGAVAAGP